MIVRFHPDADEELLNSRSWYARKRLGLDAEFMRCVDEAIMRIKRNPRRFPIALRQARKATIKRFPYTLYFEANETEIMVLAVFHAKRDPEIWMQRVDS